MADGTGFHLNPAMGRDLMAGHVHKDRHGRSPAPAASHRPVGKKRMQHAVSDRSPKRTEAPEIPRLRALEAQAAAIPISSSAASSTSPRSGSSRVNPYPVGEAIESSPFELVPSVATQATQSWEQGGSLELTPIRDDTSPTTPSVKPTQVMSPNLGQGLASGSNQAEEGEAEMDTAMARAILQSWSETRAEDGSVQRTYTQCAREWPLLGMEAFENIEVALNVLKRACEYLHEGMMQMGRTVEQKANIPSVEAAVRELAQHTQEVRSGVQRTVTRQTELSNRLDNMTEHLQAARGRMEALSAQLDHGGREHMALVVEYRQSIEETQRRLSQLGGLIEHSQVDNQRLDKGLTDLRENVFNNGVAIDHLKEDMEREVAKLSTLSGPAPDVSAYKRHAASQDEALTQCRSQLTAQAQRIEDGQQHLRRLQQEVTELIGQSTPRVEQNVPNRDPELAIRLSQLEEGMKAQQKTMKQIVKDNAEDAQDVKQYLDQVHDLLTTTLETVNATTPERATGGMTRLSKVARRGDLRIDVEDSDFCKVGEIVLVGGQEARTVMGKSSLIFKVPLNGEYPEGTTVRTLRENEFLQLDGEHVYVYAQDLEGQSHMVCGVDLVHQAPPEWAEERDEVQDQAYSDDLDQRVRRAVDARMAASRPVVSGANGPMVPPWTASHAHEWSASNGQTGVPILPSFGKKEEGEPAQEQGLGCQNQVKQEEDVKFESLDDYFCRGMDSSGPASWDKILREMEQNSLEDVGAMNYREGVREEKWGMLDLKNIQFPKVTAQSVKRATLLQYFEVDFIRAMGIISPAAATYAKAVIAGVHRDLPVYRKRDMSTTVRDWTGKMVEELWHTRAEAAVNLALQTAGVSAESLEMARMLRHDPPVRLILMTAYHRLLPYQSREEEELQQYVREPQVGDQGAVSTFQKLQAWKSAGRRLRQMGGMLPGISALMTAFDKILAAFNIHNQRGNWFYQTERNHLPMVDVTPGQAAYFFHTVEVNLNQVTTMVSYLPPSTAKAHAVDAKPKAKPKPKAKSSGPAGGTNAPTSPPPSSPVKSEGPIPKPNAQVAEKGGSPGKGKSKGAGSSTDRPPLNKKGQQCIRFYRGTCTRGDQCQYGHILGTDGKPLKIAPELLERYDRYSAARREGKKPETTVHAQMLMLNAIEQMDSRCFCLLDTGANALVLPRKDEMLGTEAQCTVPGGTVVPGTVVQTLRYGEEDYHVVAIEGASPLMPLSWLILLAGWSYMPVVKDEKMEVTIASPSGTSVTLVERSKMHYMDKATFFNVLRNAWDRCRASDGMNYDQLKRALSAAESPHVASAVKIERPSSIRFLDMNMSRKGYMRRIVDLQKIMETMTWPCQNNRPGIAGGSRGLFLGAQTNRGYEKGCVSRRTFDGQYTQVLQRVHALAKCCQKEIPYVGIYLTRLEAGQGLNQHRDYRNHEKYLNYTINFGHYLGGHLEVFRDEDWESCAAPLVWVEFTADIIQHRVREVTSGVRYSVTLFTPNHLERLSHEDWVNLESFGFPVDRYPERDSCETSVVKDPQVMEPQSVVKNEEPLENSLESTVVQAVEQKVRALSDPLESLSGQVPQPNASETRAAQLTLDSCALLTREFNAAMGLPKGELPRCIDKERGSAYGQMLWEEVQEVRDAVEGGILHGVLAESIDVLYLVFNLLQECGLERAIEPAFLLKHGDNMKKQHETVTHLACTRKEYVQTTGKSEEELAFTVSRTEGGKWLLYSKGKLIKPHDYVSSDFEPIIRMIATEESVNGPDPAPKAHSSGPHTSQYTFASVGVQVAAASIDSSMRISGEEHHHGWQPALMTSCMWMANVAGEFLYRMGEDITTVPKRARPRLVDDPLGTMEQALVDLRVAWSTLDSSAMLRNLTVLIYFAIQMTSSLHLHPYLSSAFLWIHDWQMGKIYADFAPAESAWEMMQDLTMKEIRNGYVLVSKESRVVGDDALEDKADVVLTVPVENLLMMVPYQTQLPYTGMAALDQLPPVARDKDHQVSSVELATTSL